MLREIEVSAGHLIEKSLNNSKLETASVGVNLHSLMVRFSFVRDCGSIPHGDSTVSMFFSIGFWQKPPRLFV